LIYGPLVLVRYNWRMDAVFSTLFVIGMLGFVVWLFIPMTKLRPDANSAEKMRIGFVMGLMNSQDPQAAGQRAGAAISLIERFEKIYGRKPTDQDKAILIGMLGASGSVDLGPSP
jgi:hypothetical protein